MFSYYKEIVKPKSNRLSILCCLWKSRSSFLQTSVSRVHIKSAHRCLSIWCRLEFIYMQRICSYMSILSSWQYFGTIMCIAGKAENLEISVFRLNMMKIGSNNLVNCHLDTGRRLFKDPYSFTTIIQEFFSINTKTELLLQWFIVFASLPLSIIS